MSKKHKRRFKYVVIILAPSLLIAIIALVSAAISTDSSAVAQESVPPEFQTCTECHNDTTLITGKATAWAESVHGTGEAYLRGTSASCAGCHSGGGFSNRIAAGLQPNQVTAGDPNPTRQTCRACHQIHTTYTGVDWALETTSAVDLYALSSKTFDGGEGNLCAQCHQPRTAAPVGNGSGTITGISSHWGPHHGPQSAMMLGTGGAMVEGDSAAHYQYVDNTCVGCHMGADAKHTYEPEVATCKGCHTTATNFDINGVQSDVQAKLDQLQALLENEGVLSCDEAGDCSPSVSSAPDNVAFALWNWIYIAKEDGSKGVHNPDYTESLLNTSIASVACDEPALSLSATNVYWQSMADYTVGLLSIDYKIDNVGTVNASNVNLTYSSATSGVTVASSLPVSYGSIAAGASVTSTVQYNVPPGVGSFIVTNGASADDNCGTTYTYGA